MAEPPPPWVAFPSLGPALPPTQGAEEAYIDMDWLPFWSALRADEKAAYLDRWQASPDWREAIELRYGQPGFDVTRDARESAAWAEEHRSDAKHQSSRFTRWWLRKG